MGDTNDVITELSGQGLSTTTSVQATPDQCHLSVQQTPKFNSIALNMFEITSRPGGGHQAGLCDMVVSRSFRLTGLL